MGQDYILHAHLVGIIRLVTLRPLNRELKTVGTGRSGPVRNCQHTQKKILSNLIFKNTSAKRIPTATLEKILVGHQSRASPLFSENISTTFLLGCIKFARGW